VIIVVTKDLNRSTNELWDKLFPLRAGQKVELLEKTLFVSRKMKYPFYLPKGLRGEILSYIPYSPFISILFSQKRKKYYCYLEVEKVKRILDE